jgi:hypothetical protein
VVNTFVPDSTVGARLQVGEEVEILGDRPRPS